ncbi:MAG: amino acid ABC transporter permease [Rhodobacteraceae bacterium]|jgi:polar amino acid transport system permease protein|nr:amino acid ABC transporter permease [Paracoccaceae bacterium]
MMNQAVNMLRNTRASNLVFLFALPVLIYFVATSRNYGAALTAVLGIEDQALRLLLSFFLFIALGCLGIFGSFLLIKSLRPDQEVTEVRRLQKKASIFFLLQTFTGLGISQSSEIDPYLVSVAVNSFDPRSVEWVVLVNQVFVLDPSFQENLLIRVHDILFKVSIVLGLITLFSFFFTKLYQNRFIKIAILALFLINFCFAFYILMFAYAGFAVGIMVTLRAAFFAYIGASILGLVWALFTRLKGSEFANRVFFILGILLIIFGTINVFKPHENVALVGTLKGKIGIISGTPQHVTDTVRYGDFLNSEPEKPFKIRSLKSIDQAKKLIEQGSITATVLSSDEIGDFPILWETSYLPTRNKKFAICGYVLGALLLLLGAIGRLTSAHPLAVFSDFFVDTIRGIPMLVIILYVGLPLAGAIKSGTGGIIDMQMMTRGIIAIAIGYSAYMAEIFRAGIEAIPKGQIESARTLGLREWHVARFIIIPQAIAIVLPALGNEFIAMLKDTSLVSILSVRDLTQRMKEFQAQSFLAFEPFNSAALIYVILTLIAASGIKSLDKIVNKAREH